MTKDELKQRLEENGVGQLYPALEAVLKPSIGLYLSPLDEEKISIGQTKFGGRPDLPADYSWPVEKREKKSIRSLFSKTAPAPEDLLSKPLAFIAQLNLHELSEQDDTGLLPREGILYFFYTAERDAWGYDPKDHDKFLVYYHSGNVTDLVRRDFPVDLKQHAHFKPARVSVMKEVSIPPFESNFYNRLDEETMDTLYSMELSDSGNRILGYADVIQNEMELECEMVTNKVFCGDAIEDKETISKFSKEAENWQLLLQVDSNCECNMMWGDAGMLYYWIKLDDLRAKRFDRSWLILQCS